MRKLRLIALASLLLWACKQKGDASATTQQRPALSLPAEAHIQRIVCFKFKAGTAPAAIAQHMRGFANLKTASPTSCRTRPALR
jgi:outer membrane biogenesis lipoprotein LolB